MLNEDQWQVVVSLTATSILQSLWLFVLTIVYSKRMDRQKTRIDNLESALTELEDRLYTIY